MTSRIELFLLAIVNDSLLETDMDHIYLILSDLHSLVISVEKSKTPLKDGTLSTLHP